MENNYCVYMHTLKTDGRKYIGLTKNGSNPNARWHNGHGYSQQPYFYRAIKKYGWNAFSHKLLFENLTKEQASSKEKACIKLFNTQDPKLGFNVSGGGDHIACPKKKYISYDEIYYQYITLKKSQSACASYFNCSQSHIWDTLRDYNIYKVSDREHYNKKLDLSQEALYYQYVVLGNTIQACARYFNCSSTGIYRYLDEYGIPVRKPVTNISYDDLNYAYVSLGLSIQECALRFGCCHSTVSKHLKLYGIANKLGITKENLYHQLIELHKTTQECADYFKCTTRTIYKYKKKFNLKDDESTN